LNISITLVRRQKFTTYIKNFHATADALTGVKGKPNGGKIPEEWVSFFKKGGAGMH